MTLFAPVLYLICILPNPSEYTSLYFVSLFSSIKTTLLESPHTIQVSSSSKL